MHQKNLNPSEKKSSPPPPPPHLRKPYLPSEESTPEKKIHPFFPPPPLYYKISPATMLLKNCTIINNVKKCIHLPPMSPFFYSTFLKKNHYLNSGGGGLNPITPLPLSLHTPYIIDRN